MINIKRPKRISLLLAGMLVLIYIMIVIGFEASIGFRQPQFGNATMIITTTADGASHDRVVARLEYNGRLYVAANHWPRAWYHQALDNPRVAIDLGDSQGDYLATTVTESEHRQLDAAFPIGPQVRFMTGYPPRRFLRLQPVD